MNWIELYSQLVLESGDMFHFHKSGDNSIVVKYGALHLWVKRQAGNSRLYKVRILQDDSPPRVIGKEGHRDERRRYIHSTLEAAVGYDWLVENCKGKGSIGARMDMDQMMRWQLGIEQEMEADIALPF